LPLKMTLSYCLMRIEYFEPIPKLKSLDFIDVNFNFSK